MKATLSEMAMALKENKAYRIFFHKNPDGDAIGTAYALANGLRSLGIRCAVYCSDAVPEPYRYLTEGFVNDVVPEDCPAVAVDLPGPNRLGKYESEKIDYCIDHHENNRFSDALAYVEEGASSCAELMLKVLEAMDVAITKEIANLLYVGLVTDTLCFRTWSTNEETLKVAARLAGYRADIAVIARRHALIKTPQRMEIESVLCSSFHYTCNRRVLGCMFTYDDMCRIGIDDSQLGGLNYIVEQVAGVEIGIVVRETRPSHCRVSVRTGKKCNAAEICAMLGGGGHANAAGVEMESRPSEALARVEAACAEYLRKME